MLDTLGRLFVAAVLAGTPLLLGAIGEILTERAGNLNLGVEGMMFMGAISGLAGSYTYEQAVLAGGGTPSGVVSALVALVCSLAAGMLGALVYSFLTISLRANQNVTGLTLTIFGTGFGNFFGEYIGQNAGGYVAVSSVTKDAFSGWTFPSCPICRWWGRCCSSTTGWSIWRWLWRWPWAGSSHVPGWGSTSGPSARTLPPPTRWASMSPGISTLPPSSAAGSAASAACI